MSKAELNKAYPHVKGTREQAYHLYIGRYSGNRYSG